MTFWRFLSDFQPLLDSARPSTFDWFYCYCRPPERGRSLARSWSAVRCGAPVNIPISFWSRAAKISLFPSVLMLPHLSGQISKTTALYYTPANYRKRWVYTTWSIKTKSERLLVHDHLCKRDCWYCISTVGETADSLNWTWRCPKETNRSSLMKKSEKPCATVYLILQKCQSARLRTVQQIVAIEN